MKEESKFVLPKGIVTLKYIHRNRGMAANVDANHVISGGMLTNAIRRFVAPLQRNGSIKNILSDSEKETLEGVTGLNLSVYGDFWKDFSVTLRKEDASNVFDLENPMDYISVRILESLTQHEIAPSWAERHSKATYQFAITRDDEELLEDKKKFDVKKEAFKLFGKIEDDKSKLIGVLKLLTNKPISEETSLDWLNQKVGDIVDSNPKAFVSVVTDKAFYTKMLINEGIDKNVIVKKSNKYATVDGLELCNSGEVATFDNAIAFLDNPKNQEIRNLIEAKINKAK